MKNTELTELINNFNQAVNDELYTSLLDHGTEPGQAYEHAFNSNWTFEVSDDEVVSEADILAEQDLQVPTF